MSIQLNRVFTYPYDNDSIMRQQKRIKRQLLTRDNVNYIEKRIAILNGSTTDDIKNILELFLLYNGIKPVFYQSEYNRFYEDAVFGNDELDAFQPELIIVFTSVVNIINKPQMGDSPETVADKLKAEMNRFQQVWRALTDRYQGIIIQNNMDFPADEQLGSLGAVVSWSMSRFVETLNTSFAEYAATHKGFYLNDLHRLSAKIGLEKWHNRFQYYAYKLAMDYDVIPEVANNLAKIICAILGRNKKCLVLDLDNTLWGGIIGDDGSEHIQIGHETPEAEAFTAFQCYVQELRKRGILLAVASKNEEETAKSGFDHPDSILKVSDFVAFYANWEPKNLNIKKIAAEINIGTDSLVFIDDNPVERQLVRDTMPEVAVPEIDANDVYSYIRAIEGAGYFEPVAISEDDMKRNTAYKQNQQRKELAENAVSYDEFLQSLQMEAEIAAFRPVYYDRIAQLTNKSNQFNLTTCRYTQADIEAIARNTNYVTLYGRLADKFGDNGLISVVICEKKANELHICLWLMSCRVLKRGMEYAMLDAVIKKAQIAGCEKLIGYYYKTPKNKMVADLYRKFGFRLLKTDKEDSIWELALKDYRPMKNYIQVKEAET